jgi:hypothetical protein
MSQVRLVIAAGGRHGAAGKKWTSKTWSKPADAWGPSKVLPLDTTGFDETETVVAEFQNAKAIHDDWH